MKKKYKTLMPRENKLTQALTHANPPNRKNRPKIDFADLIPTKSFVVPTNKYIARKARQRITLPRIIIKDAGNG